MISLNDRCTAASIGLVSGATFEFTHMDTHSTGLTLGTLIATGAVQMRRFQGRGGVGSTLVYTNKSSNVIHIRGLRDVQPGESFHDDAGV